MPRSCGLMRPSGRTAVASVRTSPAPATALLPKRRGGVTPDNLVAGKVGLRIRIPLQSGAVRELLGFDFDVGGHGRREGKRAERGRVDARDVRDVTEIAKFRKIAKLDAVFFP